MKVPIPNDWDEKTWTCVQVEWPDSPEWFGLLAGILSLLTRGRYWDEGTGSIIDTQNIAREAFERAYPFVSCSGGELQPPDPETFFAVTCGCGDEDIMGACGYNPKAFKIEDGKLFVRDFCGDWVEIGELADQPAVPPEEDIPPLPPEYTNSTACSMASKLAVFTYNIVAESFAQVDGEDLGDVFDYYNDMQDAFAGVDLAFDDLMNMWAQTTVLDVAGFEGETKSLDAVDYLKCNWVDLITARDEGVTEAEYLALIDATDAALRDVFPKGGWSGFADEARRLWVRAVQSIGPKDAAKITYYAQPTPGQNCDCPESDGPTNPTPNGWYLSRKFELTATATGDYNTKMCLKTIAEHDAYGCAYQVEWDAPTFNIKRMSDASAGCAGHDVAAWGDSSDHLEWEPQLTVWGAGVDTVLTELFGAGNFEQQSCNYQSSVVAVPGVDPQEVVAHGYYGDNMEVGQYYKITLRLIYNINSQSHS